MPKIILTTGGTGGHIFPALAVAEALKARGDDILFIGATYGPEAELCARADVPFIGLPGRGMLGRGLRAIPAAFDLGAAFFLALRQVRRFGPCAVAAFGGYASFAPALAAVFLRIPLLVHEQNAIAGASNRFLGRFATTICASAPQTAGFGQTPVLTGNPVRMAIARSARKPHAGLNLLVLGGSQGAHALNQAVVSMLPALSRAGINIRHQTGKRDFAAVQGAYVANGQDAQAVQPFMDDMAEAYAWADLALCRAGASTLAELCIAGLPAILVPFPAAIHDHQTLNARALAQAGAAILLPEPQLEGCCDLILDLAANRQKLAAMAANALKLAKPKAARHVADEIGKLCQ